MWLYKQLFLNIELSLTTTYFYGRYREIQSVLIKPKFACKDQILTNILQYVSQKTVPLTKDSVVKGTICCDR